MGTYANLSTQDKAVVQNTVQLIRAAAGSMSKVWNTIKAISDDTNATGLVSGLDAGEIIPNESGFAGADDMTKTQIVSVYTIFTGIRTTHDTAGNRALMSQAAGINNTLGSL